MGRWKLWGALVAAWLGACGGTGGAGTPASRDEQPSPSRPPNAAEFPGGQRPVSTVAAPPALQPSPVCFQPGYHLAMRSSLQVSTPTTFRLRVPLQRGGAKLRLTFRSGAGTLRLFRVFVATDAFPSPTPVLFSGAPGVELHAWSYIHSDAVVLPVEDGEDVVVNLEAEGALAASAIEHLPEGERRDGQHADRIGVLGGTAWRRAVGVTTIDVEATPTPVVVAIGDSITEGYVSGVDDDVREAWPSVAARRLGFPVLNAGVSGQGVLAALAHLEAEVLVLRGISDCVVLLGTNDLHSHTAPELTARLTELYGRLRPFCRVWGATLPPKARSSTGKLEPQKERRAAVNYWLRTQASVEGPIDFELVLHAPSNLHAFQEGLDEDQIHPNEEGQRRMGEEAARLLRTVRLAPP